MLYKYFIRPVFFCFPPEFIHKCVTLILKTFYCIPFWRPFITLIYTVNNENLKKELFGLTFTNPVGLAAGFDKDAKLFNELACFGFGFIEIGTVTPLPQPGNPKPRLFRLIQDNAIINRMGFNNEGIEATIKRLKKRNTKIIIGGNIGKNKVTTNEDAINDYIKCFETLFDYVDYFAINVSSPNTPELRNLQEKKPLTQILSTLQQLNTSKAKRKPILLKIAPDLTHEQIDDIIDIVIETQLDGIIATNTSVKREGLKTNKQTIETIGAGGLSGIPLKQSSTEIIRYIAEKSDKKFKIIGVGGIHSPADAVEKLNAGADLVQIYTGFIYEGASLIKKINNYILKKNVKMR